MTESAEAQAAYLLEDGFTESPPGSLSAKIRERGSLRIKFGVDPTAPAVPWGWSVPLRRLRRFQELGHTAVLVIGDFTAQVGDPSGRSATRRRLTAEEVDHNLQSCMAGVLDILSSDNIEIRRNSEWLGSMSMAEVMNLTAHATVAQILERDDFTKRFSANEPISLIEFMYPLLQAMDSVAIESDVELGGTDQFFNVMFARRLQERFDQSPQAIVSAPLLVGTDGKKKMSQSLGNYIAVSDDPGEIFGKAMSVPDSAMEEYVHLALDLRPDEKRTLLADLDGVVLKRRLAREMVAMFHGDTTAEEAEAAFDRVFVRRQVPEDIAHTTTSERHLPRLLLELGWVSSTSDARRSIKGGGVRVDGTRITDEDAELAEGSYTLQFGKRRFQKVTIG